MTDFIFDNGNLVVVTPDEAFRVVVGDAVSIVHADGFLGNYQVISINDNEIIVAVNGNIIAGSVDESIVAVPISDLEEVTAA